MRNLRPLIVALFCTALFAGDAPPAGLAVLAKTAKRTPWAQAFQEKSQHFTVITNTSKELCKQMSQALEQQYRDFVYRFQIAKEPKEPLPVKVFAEKAEFQKYNLENKKSTSDHVAGFYDPNKKEIVLFWSDDPEDVLSTLYHETTHYFIDLYAFRGNAPMWMNEGLAVYFETAQFKNGRLETGRVPYGRLLDLQDAIKAGKNHKLSQLLKFEDYGENGYNLLAYAEGWALVYFFATSAGGKNAKLFGAYMDEIQKGRTNEIAFQRAFGVSAEQLEPIWKRYTLEIGANSPQGWYERALAYHYDSKQPEALAACDTAIKLDAKLYKAQHLRGIVLFFMRKMPEALEALTKATAADPTDPRSFFYLARTHEALDLMGDKRGSEQAQEAAFLKAIELRPDYAHALGLLAWLYATANDPKVHKIKDAIILAERAVELDPTPDVLDTLAEAYFQDKQIIKAIETERKALGLNPPDKEYYQEQLKRFQAAK